MLNINFFKNEITLFLIRLYIIAVVAQLVRALPCHGRGRGFESHRPRNKNGISRFFVWSTTKCVGHILLGLEARLS